MKSYASTLGCVVALAFAVVAVNSASAQNGPVIPAWVHVGVTVMYDGVSAFISNGRPAQPVQVVMTTRVTAVGGGQVSAVTLVQTVGTPLRGSHAWTCNAAGICRGDATGMNNKFWVDPANPAASARGPNGEPYTVMGNSPYSYGGKTWAATTMSYQNPANGVQYMCVFETKTGLIVAYSESNPTQQVHTYLRSVSGQ
ncbi:MAG: hypothetical protein WAM91_01590 [Candidatus Acidiferrales bacterium]